MTCFYQLVVQTFFFIEHLRNAQTKNCLYFSNSSLEGDLTVGIDSALLIDCRKAIPKIRSREVEYSVTPSCATEFLSVELGAVRLGTTVHSARPLKLADLIITLHC